MMPPTPSTAASSSRLAERMASSEPNQPASARAATGPTWRMLSATRMRHRSWVFALSRFSSSTSADFDGTLSSSPHGAAGSKTPSRFGARLRRNGVTRLASPVFSSTFTIPVSASRTTTVMGTRSAIVSSNRPASVSSGGSSGSSGWVSAAAATSPRPSMSSAPRDATCSTRPRTCAGQLRAFGQRRSMSPSLAGRSGVWHSGQSVGMTNSRSVPSRSSTTGPSTSGMTSPALRSTTVSPMSTPLAFTTCWLCSVAWRTSDPATSTFSMTANGVARPVRPTLTTMSRSVVLTSSGGYLYAVAHRGARLVAPSSSWSPRSSTLTTMPSIWCSTSARCAPCRRTNSVTSEMSSNTRKCVEMGRPQPASSPYTSDCADTWASLASSRTGHAPMPCTSMRRRRIRARMSSRRAGLLPSSFWRRDPAAAFRGFAKTRSPTSSCRAFSSSNSATGKKISPRTSTSGGCPDPMSRSGTVPMVRTFCVTSSPTTPSPRVAAVTRTPCS